MCIAVWRPLRLCESESHGVSIVRDQQLCAEPLMHRCSQVNTSRTERRPCARRVWRFGGCQLIKRSERSG